MDLAVSRTLSAQSSWIIQLWLAEEDEEEEEEVLITSDLRLDPDPGLEWNTFLGSIPPTDLS